MTADHRRAERHELCFKLLYDDGADFYVGTVRDVSETGLFMETTVPLPQGTIVRITPLNPAGDSLFELQARVIRSVDSDFNLTGVVGGMAVDFVDISNRDRHELAIMICALEEQADTRKSNEAAHAKPTTADN